MIVEHPNVLEITETQLVSMPMFFGGHMLNGEMAADRRRTSRGYRLFAGGKTQTWGFEDRASPSPVLSHD